MRLPEASIGRDAEVIAYVQRGPGEAAGLPVLGAARARVER
jgi:hypothetical protein